MKLPVRCNPLIVAALIMSTSEAGIAAAVPTAEPGGETVALWPAGVPGAEHVEVRQQLVERAPDGPLRDRIAEHVTQPLVTLFHAQGKPNGITLLIVPGGGYVRVVIDKEGFESAEWFARRGFECAVLRYRMPADGWAAGPDAPVHDAMRALRLLRSRHRGATPAGFGVIGFSAGGHLVARLITEASLAYPRQDAADDLSARPDFAVLMYPVIATTGAAAHGGSAAQLQAAGVPAAQLARYSPHLQVSAATPPTLLVHAADDEAVPVENSLLMFGALRAAGVRSELHVFDRGGHGFGMRGIAGLDAAAWPQLVETWALANAQP
ncbi:MAG TPA: alpha/beta hydrolase [Steroidobacteraceae bacterium]|nr:alpha/beta hydrolase [Steroidobacteraceae bacterium]